MGFKLSNTIAKSMKLCMLCSSLTHMNNLWKMNEDSTQEMDSKVKVGKKTQKVEVQLGSLVTKIIIIFSQLFHTSKVPSRKLFFRKSHKSSLFLIPSREIFSWKLSPKFPVPHLLDDSLRRSPITYKSPLQQQFKESFEKWKLH